MSEYVHDQPSGDREQNQRAYFDEICAAIDDVAVEHVVQGGRFYGEPNADSYKAPFDASTAISINILTEEGEEPVRVVSSPYHNETDRGSMGVKLYTDGRVTSFTNGEVQGVVEKDTPEDYQRNLERANAMLKRREEEINSEEQAVAPKRQRVFGKVAVRFGFTR